MKDHYRAVVIGGGVVGCSVLYHLAKAGWTDVILIERSELTSGSSWHAAGGFHTLNGDPNVAKLQAYTVSLYDELEKLSGQSCGLHLTGGVMLADSEERMDFLRMTHARGRYLGMQTELITPSEAKAMFPLMDESHFVGALWDPVEGHLDPSGTTHAYAKAARVLGAEIALRNPVTELTQDPDGTWNVVTQDGTIRADHVVNAGGLWAREVGRMVGLELPVLAMEHMYLLTEPMPEVAEFNESAGRELIGIIDFKGEIYTRQERDGMLLGTYEQACVPWQPHSTPWDFGHELLQPDIDRISPSLEIGFRHFPAFERAGIKQIVNGPFTFAPDGNPLIGPVDGLTNYWCACAVMAGFSQGGGVGLALANWMTEGDPGHDVFAMDVTRFGEWATSRYTNAKVRENYSRRFSISYPNEQLMAGRPQMTSPLYDTLLAQGAVMGDNWGLEAPMWFAPSPDGAHDIPSFRRSNDFEHIAREVKQTRETVGVTEISNFAKYEVTGPQAEAFLDRLMTNRMPKIGRIVLTPMLNEAGRLIGDFTIAKLADDRFMMWGSIGGQKYHMRWFERELAHLRCTHGAHAVHVRRMGLNMVGLSIAGPKSRDVLAALTDRDLSDFRFMDVAEMDVNGAPCIVNRISYSGDLGYELWMEPAYQRRVYAGIKEAGKPFDIIDFGVRALLSMRLEKNFPTWAAELRPIYTPTEAGMDMWVKPNKGDFIGRDALARHENPLRRVTFVVDADNADVIGDEPIWARIGDTDYGNIEPTHDYGGTRFDADGKALEPTPAHRDGDWRVVGWVTSGGYGHHVAASLAQGYIPPQLAGEGDTEFAIEILGQRRPARIAHAPLFDPEGNRMRA